MSGTGPTEPRRSTSSVHEILSWNWSGFTVVWCHIGQEAYVQDVTYLCQLKYVHLQRYSLPVPVSMEFRECPSSPIYWLASSLITLDLPCVGKFGMSIKPQITECGDHMVTTVMMLNEQRERGSYVVPTLCVYLEILSDFSGVLISIKWFISRICENWAPSPF